MKGNGRVQVALRLRPAIPALDDGDDGVRKRQDQRATIYRLKDKPGSCGYRDQGFHFANVFGPEADNVTVFEAHRAEILRVLSGFDCMLMAYGTTGSGKTHTMIGSEDDLGMVPRAVKALFEQIAKANTTQIGYSLQFSALEILEEKCIDLLHGRRNVVLQAAGSSGLHFHNLGEVHVRSEDEVLSRFHAAMAARTLARNYKHEGSSRAHTIIRLRVESAVFSAALEGAPALAGTSAVLTLADLAGSEAATMNTNHEVVRQGLAVNKSLHWLKVVVHNLAAKKPTQLRNSVLTRLLEPALSGQAYVAVIVASSETPPENAERDTVEALQFGVAAGSLVVAPKRRTETSKDGKVGRLQALLAAMAEEKSTLTTDAESLRDQVSAYSAIVQEYRDSFVSSQSLKAAEEEAARIAAELQSAHERNEGLQAQLKEEQEARENVQSQLKAIEEQAVEATSRNDALQHLVQQTAERRRLLEARLQLARGEMEEARLQAEAYEAQLKLDQRRATKLEEQVQMLEESLREQKEKAENTRREAEALAAHNSMLQESERVEQTNAEFQKAMQEKEGLAAVSQAKDRTILLRHKMYTSGSRMRRPSTAMPATPERQQQAAEETECQEPDIR
ncbi:hypothetical protein AB1Y20_001737 [Prymnesium parvum]|uniref:Kinesin motor domain-containing protein n=1 Tax=Prymnesium parvum TaxID=97485 RepID=A0AB34KBQ2_PRYPA